MTPEQCNTALASSDAEVRRAATIALTSLIDSVDNVESLLVRALGDADWRVREEAVRVGKSLADRIDIAESVIDGICQGENVGLRNAALALVGTLGAKVEPPLRAALASGGPDAKKFLIEALARAVGRRAVPAIVEQLGSADANMVAAALDALATVGGEEGEAALRSVLSWSDPLQRMAAMDALNRLEAVVPWSELEPLLRDRLVFRVAVPALGRCRDPRAIGPLMEALEDTSSRVAADTVMSLGRLSSELGCGSDTFASVAQGLSPAARARLAVFDEQDSLSVREGAAAVLCHAQDARGMDAALQLANQTGGVSPLVTDALLGWGHGAVLRLLDDEVWAGGPHAAAGLELAASLLSELADRGSEGLATTAPRLRAELRKALLSNDPDLRIVAGRGLLDWAEVADAVPLAEAVLRQEEVLSLACGDALSALAQREPHVVRDALGQVDLAGPGLQNLVSVLVSLDGVRALGRLQALLLSDDVRTRCAALSGISQLPDQRAADVIGLALTDADIEVRLAAARALGDLPDGIGVPALLRHLDTDSPDLLAALARALGATGSAKAEAPLRALLTDRSSPPAVQLAALTSLHALGVPGLRGLLVDALQVPDPEVVKAALGALAAEGDAFDQLATGLTHPRWDVRQLAADLVALSGQPQEAEEALRARLEVESDDMVRGGMADALQRVLGSA